MVASTDPASKLRPPVLDIPLQASCANYCRSPNRQDTNILCKTPARRRINPIESFLKQKSDALVRQQNNPPNTKRSIHASRVEVVNLRKTLIHTAPQAPQSHNIQRRSRPADNLINLHANQPQTLHKIRRLLVSISNNLTTASPVIFPHLRQQRI